LRGYEADGDRIARLIGRVDGLTASAATPYDDALMLATRSPNDQEQNLAPLQPETPAPVAVANMLAQFAAVIDDNVAGTVAAIDIEFLHDLRVAVRRTRSILKLAGDVLPGNLAERFQPDELAKVAADSHGGKAASSLARQRIERAFRNVVRRGKRITADSPSEQVHELRKRCKELRYLLEVFRPLFADAQYRPLIKELKALQDTLGDFQDGEVQREAVREFAAAMMEQGAAPPATVLAMGELAAQLDAHQLNARGDLVGVLRPFLAKDNRARIKALVR
jgi:CHAD domain-containing protein